MDGGQDHGGSSARRNQLSEWPSQRPGATGLHPNDLNSPRTIDVGDIDVGGRTSELHGAFPAVMEPLA